MGAAIVGSSADVIDLTTLSNNLGEEAALAFERAREAADGFNLSENTKQMEELNKEVEKFEKQADISSGGIANLDDAENAEKERVKLEQTFAKIRESNLRRTIEGERTLLIERFSALNIQFKNHKQELLLINDEFLLQLQALNDKEKSGAMLLAEELRLAAMEDKARELEELRLQFNEKLELTKGNEELRLALEEDFARRRANINDKFHKAEIAQSNERAKKEEASSQAKIDAWGNLAVAIVGSVGKIAGALGASAKAQKKIALVEAIIHGALAVQKALSSAIPPINFINAAAVGIAAAGNIATIASQAFAHGGFPTGRNAMVRVNESGH